MKIGARGQITIPQHFRQRFGLNPATEIEFEAVDGRLVLKKAAGRKNKVWEKNYGILKAGDQRTDDLMNELRDQ